jgi:hypothetical protein
MGYMGLEHPTDSDAAADLAYTADKALVEVLEAGLKDPGNQWNTPGCVNVALYLEHRLKTADYGDEMPELVQKTINALKAHVEKCNKADWDSEKNKRWHLTAFKRLVKSLEKLL